MEVRASRGHNNHWRVLVALQLLKTKHMEDLLLRNRGSLSATISPDIVLFGIDCDIERNH